MGVKCSLIVSCQQRGMSSRKMFGLEVLNSTNKTGSKHKVHIEQRKYGHKEQQKQMK